MCVELYNSPLVIPSSAANDDDFNIIKYQRSRLQYTAVSKEIKRYLIR